MEVLFGFFCFLWYFLNHFPSGSTQAILFPSIFTLGEKEYPE